MSSFALNSFQQENNFLTIRRMKIFTILMIFAFYINTTDGQVLVDSVKKPVRIKAYRLSAMKDFKTFDIGGKIGITYPYTDISASGKRNFALAIDVTKFLTHTFALQTRFLHASLSGVDIYKPQYRFNTTINYDLTLNAVFQFGNISFLKHNPNLAIYTSFGIGLIHHSPKVYTEVGQIVQKGIYSQYSQPLVEMDYRSTTDLIIPIGIGVKYRLAENYSITCEYSFRTTNSDKLDGFYKLLSSSDKYSFFGAGFTYHLGKKSKVLQWVNPIQVVYKDLFDMKVKIDQLSKDTDMDGVPDFYDRGPNTPQGIKVYGDGTAVDSDMDGMPDNVDAEMFSEKNAIVDSTGREIKKTVQKILPDNPASNQLELKSDSSLNSFVDAPVTKTESININPNKTDTNIPMNSGITGNITPVISESSVRIDSKKSLEMHGSPAAIIPNKQKSDSLIKISIDNKSMYENYTDLPSIYFASGENKISAKHYKTLDYIALVLKNNPSINYNIIGVCDNSGSLQYNLSLSKRRAETVKRYLERNYNINPGRLSINTIGTYDSVQGNSQMSRRVDFKVRN